MARENVLLQQFNRGIISPLALARVDVARTQFAADTMTNWMPRVLGSMMLRPGLGYLGSTQSDAAARFIPFVFSTDDTALIEITDSSVRVWESETVVTRPDSATTITNSDFTLTTGWTDADDSGGTSTLASQGAYLSLIGDGSNYARRRQSVTLNSADEGLTLGMKVVIKLGPVVFRVGASAGNDTYINQTTLEEGEYSFAFAPLGDFVIEFENNLEREVLVQTCEIEDNVDMAITAPWAAADLGKIRYEQSGDVIFLACDGYQQYKIERKATSSWGVVKYQSDDGPYLLENTTTTTITPSALTGNITLTASSPIFSDLYQGAIFAIESDGQTVSADVSAENTFTNTIKVSGVDSQRIFTIVVAGTWAGTVTLERSLTSDAGPWESLDTWTANTTGAYDDTLDNQIAWYRIGIETGDYTSGTAELTLDYPIGSIRGVARVIGDQYSWYTQTAPLSTASYTGCAWSDDLTLFCAVGSAGSGNTVGTSPDGLTWTARTPASNSAWQDVEWGSGASVFVAVAANNTTSAAMSSADGITWTTRTTPGDEWNSVCWSQDDTLFVAVGQDGSTNQVMTSPDGTTWTGRSVSTSARWKDVIYSSSLTLYVAVGYTAGVPNTPNIMTSPDGTTWTDRTISGVTQLEKVAWSEELSLFVAVSTVGDFATSSDGITWSGSTDGTKDYADVIWVAEKQLFYLILSGDEDGTAIYSYDGTTSTLVGALEAGNTTWAEMVYGASIDRFIAVGNNKSTSTAVIVASPNTPTSVRAEVLTALGGTNASQYWSEGRWSDARGWPTSVTLTEGRLWWAGRNGIAGSVSDDYYNFNPTTEGDSAPISRTIGIGPVDNINWMLALQRLVIGTEGNELICRSNALDEPLTTTNFNIKPATDQGSPTVSAIRVDKAGIFVQRGGTRVMQLVYNGGEFEYDAEDLTILSPEVCQPQVVRIAKQRQPDTRIHCVLSDGTVAILVYDRAEDVKCWFKVTTDGTVEDVVVLPGATGDTEDQVYYIVNRTINGSTVRYLEKWATEANCEGGSLNYQADSYLVVSQSSSTSITGLTHLEGETVVVWANGKDLGSYTVSSGAITVSEVVTTAIVGLGYTAQWKSSKLAYAARQGTALLQKKRIPHVGVILQNTHYQGLEYGPDFTNMDNLPLTKDGATIDADTVHATYDEETFAFMGEWDTDSRLCLQATAPKPCNILAAVMGVEVHEKV